MKETQAGWAFFPACAFLHFLRITQRKYAKNKTKNAIFKKYVYAFEKLRTRLRLICKKRKGEFVQKEESTPIHAKLPCIAAGVDLYFDCAII
jgi:hypothetical protein